MASVHRAQRSPFWYAAFYSSDGTRAFRSTKCRKRGAALQVAIEWEKASRQARDGRLTEAQARRVISDIYTIANGEKLTLFTAEGLVKEWLKTKLDSIAERSRPAYEKVAAEWIKHLGSRASIPAESITAKDVLAFRTVMSVRVSAGTVNQKLNIMRGCWSWGMRLSFVPENPWKAVEMVTGEKHERRALSLSELKELLVACGETEWRTMVLLGLYTGQRLMDIASLTWRQVDLKERTITFLTQKTKRRQIIPMHSALVAHLLTLPSSDDPDTLVMPEIGTSADTSISRQFVELLVHANLVKKDITHRKRKNGRDARRVQSELSYHSLRHTATTLLKSTGASDVIAREIIGHDSEAISRGYTHIETETLRRAVDAMPDVMAQEVKQ